ncbi:hypothetical protein LWI29_027840 [Acer saccharum]|uniref:Uncharacterized protein n=1 Tax=Acer saccharum TaxID=4024 RepID=A0AA39RJ38_ACESA|nr:hypothetical protein LWI29_027840 [Acer saccharum]
MLADLSFRRRVFATEIAIFLLKPVEKMEEEVLHPSPEKNRLLRRKRDWILDGIVDCKEQMGGHSKEGCKAGIVETEVEVQPVEEGICGDIRESNPYGPWMQVSYGRNYKNNLGNRHGNWGTADGKKNGLQGSGGKAGNGVKQGYEPQTVGEDKNRQTMDNTRSLDSAEYGRHVKGSTLATKSNRRNLKKVHGSRFAVLNDIAEVEEAEEELQGHSGLQIMDNSPNVLAEISNRSSTGKR